MPDEDLRLGAFGDRTRELHAALSSQGFEVPLAEVQRGFFGPATHTAVREAQTANGLSPTGVVDAATLVALAGKPGEAEVKASQPGLGLSPVVVVGDFQPGLGLSGMVSDKPVSGVAAGGNVTATASVDRQGASVAGTVVLDYGASTDGLPIRIYSIAFGGARSKIGETRTGSDGSFSVAGSPAPGAAIRVYAVDANGTEVPLSGPIPDASELAGGALVAPGHLQPPASEYRRMVADVQPYLNGANLNDAVERGDRSDFTLLSNSSGWDVGALAMGAAALDGANSTGVPAEAFYALSRVGLPANPAQLARTHPDTVEQVLRLAADAGVIDPGMVGDGLASFKTFAVARRLNTPPDGTVSSRKDFINMAAIPDADKTAFSAVSVEPVGAEIWTRAASAGVSDDSIRRLQLQGKLAYLTFNSAPLVQELQSTVRDAAQIADQLVGAGYHEVATWSATLDKLSSGDETKLAGLVPDVFSGTSTADKRDAYCVEMARRVRQMDPHRVTIERVARGGMTGVDAASVGPLLRDAHAKGFRLGTTPVSQFFATDGASLAADPGAVKGVKKLAAMYALSPSDEAMDALLQAEMTSATQIARYSLPAFGDMIRPFLFPHYQADTQRVIESIYWKAQQHSATVFNVFDGLRRLDTIRAPFAATPHDLKLREAALEQARSKVKALFASWETLFGSVDYCECDHCRSVLSPAAYLVDILHFLDPDDQMWATEKANFKQRFETDYPSQQKPFDLLDVRRPDLKKIALTCENTNVELPYIDLVNEILEELMLSESAATESIEAYDVGTATSADLIAEPQHLQWDAYVGSSGRKGLRDLVFPLALPFDLSLEMARAFLHQLGIELWELRERLNRPSTLDATAVGRADGWRGVWYERLGLGPADVEVLTTQTDWFTLFGYADEGTALRELATAKTLARRLDLTYSDLVEMLVRTQFVNADAALVLHAPTAGCDFAEVTLQLAEATPPGAGIAFGLRKLNTFARLQRHLGWDIHELDRVLTGLAGNGALANASYEATMEAILVNLAHVVDLHERFDGGLEREEIVLLWSDIQTTGVDNYYDRLFLRDGPTGHDAAFDRRNGAVLGDPTGRIADHAPALQQAFLLSHDDLEAILDYSGLQNGALTVANISTIQRPALLARGLGLSVTGTLALLQLTSTAPLSSIDPLPGTDLSRDHVWSGITFLDQVRLLGDAGIDPETLVDLCYGVEPEAPDPSADPATLAVLALPSEPSPPAGADPPSLTDAQRAAAAAANAAQRETALVRTLAAQLGVAPKVMELLVGTVLTGTPSGPLLKSGFADPDAVAASITRIRRALVPITALGVTDKELGYLVGLKGALDLDGLSWGGTRTPDNARAVFTALQPWMEMAALRKELGRSERALAVLETAVTPVDATNTGAQRRQQFVDALAAMTGLKAAKLEALLDALGATTTTDTQFECTMCAAPGVLRRARDTLRCFTKVRIEPKQLVDLGSATIGKDAAMQLRSSLKASYSRSSWRALVQPIFDGLRAQQRDALIAHLTTLVDGAGKPKFGATPEQMFEFLLLDPAMEPVVLGSRIQMAIASVQLFVQRCFMNLEAGIDSRVIDAARWAWMRRYRVWEANRKIFLWPENWLDPELRDDMTHLFRQLESTLLQGDVSADLVRTAMYTYLQGLEQVARMHMLAMYFEPLGATSSLIHVIGRTHSVPYKYFSRSMSHGMWTPWVPIDIGIEGDHLVLTTWRGRLHMFWLTFFDEARQPPGADKKFTIEDGIDTSALKVQSKIKLKINWSEQIQGAWTSARSSPDFVEANFVGVGAKTPAEKASFFVRSVVIANGEGVNDDDLEIHVNHASVDGGHTFRFYSKLAPPLSLGSSTPPLTTPPYDGIQAQATKWLAADPVPLTPRFTSAVRFGQGRGTDESSKPLLGQTTGFSLLLPSNESMPVPETRAPAARPSARLSGYVFGDQDANHVTYRSSDGEIHDLFDTDGGWFYQSPSQDAAAASIATIEPAEHDPRGYAIDGQGAACIGYCGATTVYELVWQQLDSDPADSSGMGTAWSAEECYRSETDPGTGRPAGGIYAPDRGAAVLTATKRIIALRRDADGQWSTTELVPAGAAASEPTAVVVNSSAGGVTTVVSRHVFYVGSDGDVYELRSDATGAAWASINVTQAASAPIKPAVGSQISAYVSYVAGSVFVVYRGSDGFVHELACPPGGTWSDAAIGFFMAAKGDPCGYARDMAGERHVVYRSTADEVVELWHPSAWYQNVLSATGWYHNVLSASVPDAPLTDGEVSGYSFERRGTQHVVYAAAHGEARELMWAPDAWTPGDYRLTNPFHDTDEVLAAPFFFESCGDDDTFFVEPSIVETTVHTWTAWVVSTDEYVDPLIDYGVFTPIHPNIQQVIPIAASLTKLRTDVMKAKLFPDDVTLRTRWGTIQPRVARAGPTTLGEVVHHDAPAVVDLEAGTAARLVGSSRLVQMRAEMIR